MVGSGEKSLPGTCTMHVPLYHKEMFFLTRSEQWVLTFLLVAFLSGAAIRHFRFNHMIPTTSVSSSR